MGKNEKGLSALNALLIAETFMTEKGYFKMDGSYDLTVVGIMRKGYSPYVFEVYWELILPGQLPEKYSAICIFTKGGTLESFHPFHPWPYRFSQVN